MTAVTTEKTEGPDSTTWVVRAHVSDPQHRLVSTEHTATYAETSGNGELALRDGQAGLVAVYARGEWLSAAKKDVTT